MYKVLIVDDEVLVRIGLKTTIDWESLGFEIVAEANNGAKGFIEFEKHQPDLVFTDIKMPLEDGLWLTEKIKKQRPQTHVILLTCFDDFQMVRQSMKVGADDYILKSEIENEELEESLKRVKCQLDTQDNTSQDNKSGTSQSIKRTLMDDLINNEMQIDTSMANRLKEIGFKTEGSSYILFGIHLSQRPLSEPNKKINIKQISKALRHIFVDKLEEQKIAYIFNSKQKSYLFLLSKDQLSLGKVASLGRMMNQSARQYFDMDLKVVYSSLYTDLLKTHDHYQTFLKCKKIIFYSYGQGQKIFPLGEVTFGSVDIIKYDKPYNQMVLERLSEFNYESVKEIIQGIILEAKGKLIEPESLRIFFSNMVRDILLSYRYLRQYSEGIKKHIEWNDLIMQATYIEDVEKIVLDLVREIEKAMSLAGRASQQNLSHLAMMYINHHYMESISLEDVANHLAVSKHYLSSTFKKEVGINMSLYINQRKIEACKRYIDVYGLKNKEIYQKVGFSNQQYLSKVFKKITGMTMKEYRDQIQT